MIIEGILPLVGSFTDHVVLVTGVERDWPRDGAAVRARGRVWRWWHGGASCSRRSPPWCAPRAARPWSRPPTSPRRRRARGGRARAACLGRHRRAGQQCRRVEARAGGEDARRGSRCDAARQFVRRPVHDSGGAAGHAAARPGRDRQRRLARRSPRRHAVRRLLRDEVRADRAERGAAHRGRPGVGYTSGWSCRVSSRRRWRGTSIRRGRCRNGPPHSTCRRNGSPRRSHSRCGFVCRKYRYRPVPRCSRRSQRWYRAQPMR